MKQKDNYTDKQISEFTENDTIYMQKIVNGYSYNFYLRFKSFSKNIVTGEILDIQPNNMDSIWIGKQLYKIGDEIQVSIKKCYTFKSASGGCKWFSKKISNNWSC